MFLTKTYVSLKIHDNHNNDVEFISYFFVYEKYMYISHITSS
jgi:hypothetical protein